MVLSVVLLLLLMLKATTIVTLVLGQMTMVVWSRRVGDESCKIASVAQCVLHGSLVMNTWTQLSIVIESIFLPPAA